MSFDLRLRPYDPVHAQTVAGWPQSPKELWNWTARRDHPLEGSVLTQWHTESDVEPWLLCHDEAVIAYGEIWYEDDGSAAELGRLIVDPDCRDKGVGRRLVRELSRIVTNRGIDEKWLRVDPENQQAIACYKAAGFSLVDETTNEELNQGQRFAFAWMVTSF